MFDALDELSAQETALKKTKSLLQNRVKEALGDAAAGLLPDGRSFTYNDQTRKATPASEFRVLRRKKR